MTTNREKCLCTSEALRLLDDLERRFRSTLREQALESAKRRDSSQLITQEDVRAAARIASGRSVAEMIPSLARGCD